MRLRIAILVVLAFAGFYVGQAQDSGISESERYIRESERLWAESVATGDTSALERILADDMVGVQTNGNFYDKAKEIADTHNGPKFYISNHLNEVKIRFFGDNTAVAQGSESWVRRSGTPSRGRFVWTDTWIRRNGKWQIVAAEDLIARETPK
jgi:hypothetical protein